MNDFIGLGLLAIGLFLLTIGARWFSARFEPQDGRHYLVGDLYALITTAFTLGGAVIIVADIANAWAIGDVAHAVIGMVAIAVFAVVLWYMPSILRRRRRSA